MANPHPVYRPENLRPWKPGQSANPGGRRKGRGMSVTTILRRLMDEVDTDDAKRSVAEGFARDMLREARTGNAAYMREIMNRLEGAAPALPEADPPDHRPRDADGNPIPA